MSDARAAALPPDLQDLIMQLEVSDRDAQEVARGLDGTAGAWRPRKGAWSIAECLDHLATANRVYLAPLREGAADGRRRARLRRGPARPGFVGRWFVQSLEPETRRRLKAPGKIRPRDQPPLAEALGAFLTSQEDVRGFIRENADLDLAGLRFRNPFVAGVRFSLATGLHGIAAHDRRHLAQARAVRAAPGFPGG